MPSLRRITSNIAAQIFAIVASMGDRIVLVGLILRYWGPDMFAGYVVLQSAASLLTTAELGMQLYFINVEQGARIRGDMAAFQRYAAIHLGITLAISAPLAVGLAVFGLFGDMGQVVQVSAIEERGARAIFVILGMANLLSNVRSTTTVIYIGAGDFAYSVLVGAVVLLASTAFSCAIVAAGGGPIAVAAGFFAVYGLCAGLFVQWDTRRRYPQFAATPALPTREEFVEAATHVKWFALQIAGPVIWLQVPVLTLNAWSVTGHALTSFLILRTIANQLRQVFQVTAVGTGIEIAAYAHRGEFKHAWRLSARVGMLTTVLSANCLAAVMCFGAGITYHWTGDATLFARDVAFWLMAPLAVLSPLQQPTWLLQFANMTFTPGLQRLLQAVATPFLCILGQAWGGPLGLVLGLAAAETLSFLAILPQLFCVPFLTGFARYLIGSLAAGSIALAWALAVGSAVNELWPGIGLAILLPKMLAWAFMAALPAAALSAPRGMRAKLQARLAASLARVASRNPTDATG